MYESEGLSVHSEDHFNSRIAIAAQLRGMNHSSSDPISIEGKNESEHEAEKPTDRR